MRHQLNIALLITGLLVSSNANAVLATVVNQLIQNASDILHLGATEEVGVSTAATASATLADVATNAEGHALGAATTEAGIVEDQANFAKEVEKWVEEKKHWFDEKVMQSRAVVEAIKIKDKMQESVDKLSALRAAGESAMEKVISDADADHLPDDYTAGLQTVASAATPLPGELNTATAFEIITGRIGEAFGMGGSDTKMKMDDARAAYNRTLSELAYKQAGERRLAIKGYSDVLSSNNPNKDNLDIKDITDLQARIQSTQLELLNEQLKLQSLAVIQKSQEQVEQQMLKKQRLAALGLGQGADGSITSFISQAATGAVVWNIPEL